MKSKYIRFSLLILAFVSIIYFVVDQIGFLQKEKDIHIAFVGPMTGKASKNGNQMRRGIELYLEKINKKGGVRGHKFVLDVYDDKNDPVRAKERALEIVEQHEAVAVIGHNYSSCAIEGGEVYKRYGIPAITPSADNGAITLNNDWYFMLTTNNNLQ